MRLDLAPEDSMTELRTAWEDFSHIPSSADDKLFGEIITRELPPLDSVETVLYHALGSDSVVLVGVINPYSSPVYSKDNYIFVGLNHYLGPESEAYNGFPEYHRRLKDIRRLPIDVVSQYILERIDLSDPEDPTVLNMLLFVGAVANTTLSMLPDDTSEALLLGMTDEEYLWCRQNEQRIWQKLIEDGMLYSTEFSTIDRLFSPSPAATLINANAPGNTMSYIGLKIAQAYEKNTGQKARPTNDFINNNQTLINSKYSPQNAAR